jgi:aminoglycoside phosphotransferase (APT) family kinase protein
VKLTASDNEKVLFPLKAYWDEVPTRIHEITEGLVHSTYCVQVRESSYILQRVNTHVFKESLQVLSNIEKVTAHLLADKTFLYKVPTLVKTIIGDTSVFTDDGNHWRCFTFIEGSHTKQQMTSAEEAFQVGKAFGSFSASLSSLDPKSLYETIYGFHDPTHRLAQFEAALSNGGKMRIKEARIEIQKVKAHAYIAAEISAINLPVKVAHNDAKLSNLLFDGDGRPLSIIDLDTAMPGSPLIDFGDLVRSLASTLPEDSPAISEVAISWPMYHALEKGFSAGTGSSLTSLERNHLKLGPSYIIFEQALRFLTDFLQGDTYYRISYPTHNFIRARNQIALLESYLAG